ncbi:MAG: hypothetical protein NTZ13_04615 [Candidatus Parcubacteria bacterium]|nr:hypothetical protein [Candidatus Parcubacteria bacterium]
MTITLSDRVLLRQRKWYIQPLDPMSSEKIYRLLKNAKSVRSTETTGCPEENGYQLREADRKTVQSLMEETSINGLNSEGTDFGVNFFVYVKNRDDTFPRFCFASTSAMRAENGKKHKKREGLGPVQLKAVLSTKITNKKEPSFAIPRAEQKKHEDKKEIVPFSHSKRNSLYRITTYHKRTISLLEEKLSQAGEDTKPIPHLSEGSESVWGASPNVVLELKIHARIKFLHFRIWKKDEGGNYLLIGQYPRSLK